jgi:hypothetical protein
MTKHLLSLAALAGMFPSFFAERRLLGDGR